MDNKPPLLLPYTISSDAASVLRSEITAEFSDITIEYAPTPPEWIAYRETTVAEDNPAYPADAPVIVVGYVATFAWIRKESIHSSRCR